MNNIDLEGDPFLFPGPDGGKLNFENGQPTMDGGLENSVYLSLSMEPPFWGNAILGTQEQANSEIFQLLASSPVTDQLLLDIQEAAQTSLEWLVVMGLAESIEVEVLAETLTLIRIVVIIQKITTVQVYNYFVNWENQERAVLARELE